MAPDTNDKTIRNLALRMFVEVSAYVGVLVTLGFILAPRLINTRDDSQFGLAVVVYFCIPIIMILGAYSIVKDIRAFTQKMERKDNP